MNVGDKKTISVAPEDAYGQHKKEFVFAMERAQTPAHLKLEIGKRLQVRTNNGSTVVATITAITEDRVFLDANERLAGKTLKFEIELVGIV
jgi:FKBP-type peptidyl-prolyl cis-trans isomerase 2